MDVVTSKEIESHHYQNVFEAVRNLPGVTVNTNGNVQSSVSSNIYINGSSNVVVMVDGMRVNTYGNTLANQDIGTFGDMDSIDRIEILKGSSSTLYGADAQGGLINIITRKPEDGTMKTAIGTSFASYDGEKYNISNSGAENGFFWNIGAQKQIQGDFKDGWGRNIVNHLNAYAYNVKFGKDLGNNSDIVFQYRKYKANFISPDTGSLSDVRDKGKKDNDFISLQYRAKINDKIENKFSIFRNQTRQELNYNHQGKPSYTGYSNLHMKTTGISDQLTYVENDQTITTGIDWYRDEIPHYTGYTWWGTDQYPVGEGIEGKKVTTAAFYLQDKWDITDAWNVTGGLRYTHNSEFGSKISPSMVLGYKVSDTTNYYLSYKTFFVTPNEIGRAHV